MTTTLASRAQIRKALNDIGQTAKLPRAGHALYICQAGGRTLRITHVRPDAFMIERFEWDERGTFAQPAVQAGGRQGGDNGQG